MTTRYGQEYAAIPRGRVTFDLTLIPGEEDNVRALFEATEHLVSREVKTIPDEHDRAIRELTGE